MSFSSSPRGQGYYDMLLLVQSAQKNLFLKQCLTEIHKAISNTSVILNRLALAQISTKSSDARL